MNMGTENKAPSLNVVNSSFGEGKVGKIASISNTSLRKKSYIFINGRNSTSENAREDLFHTKRFTRKRNANFKNTWHGALLSY